MQSHVDASLARLPQTFGAARLPGLFGGWCSEEKARELETYFAPRKQSTPGLERELALTVENVRLCAAKKAAHQESARKVFAK
ncbi:MAG: hypothetical protein AB2A00_17465 [Myxococcota bacterium]